MKSDRLASWHPASSHKLLYEVLFWSAVLVLTGVVFAAYVPGLPWNRAGRNFAEFLDSSTYRPFVYRVLIPLVSEAANRIVPFTIPTYYTICIYLSLFGFVGALRSLAQTFWQPSYALDAVVLLAIPLTMAFNLEYSHVYDLPVLCLFTWGIVCIARQQWNAFLLCYAIACFNKETTLFLSLIFVANHTQDVLRGKYNKLLVMQLSIYAIIRGALMFIFQHNPGAVADYHLSDHIIIYPAYPARTLVYLAGITLVALLIARQFGRKPAFLRRSLLVALPPMVVLFALFGFPYELRVFYEVYSLVVLLCIPPNAVQVQSAGVANPSL
ncbi:MAG: hypothetical protein OHK0022_59520 [Roseiflexaceae bacterium]